ncbi:MAG: flagellin [Candidatus Cloacimonetes bacterium]|nr:flagellin [Candidatus Cloacimonadota bacterium]
MRITNQVSFYNLTNQVLNNLEEYKKIQTMISSGKKLTKPSDDAAGVGHHSNLMIQSSSYSQYLKNLSQAEDYLKATDSALTQFNEIIIRARELAEANATGTASSETRMYAADEVYELIERSIEIANTKVGEKYIFSGFKTDTPAYGNIGRILQPYGSGGNEYQGKITARGDYLLSENKDFQLKIVQAGEYGVAEYQVSDDGGVTWSGNKLVKSNTGLTDNEGNDTGIILDFEAGNFAEGDAFTISVEKGLYQGDEGIIHLNASKNSTIVSNLTGKEVFEENRYFEIMYKLQKSLENNNIVEISESLDELGTLETDMQRSMIQAGSRLNRVAISKNNLEVLQENITSTISNLEDADMIEAMSKFTLQDSALQASITALSKILPNSLLNYI